ncbi:hypothetical protein CP061683_0383B, partial [Chlamydia psittaci 06-1683]
FLQREQSQESEQSGRSICLLFLDLILGIGSSHPLFLECIP